MRAAELPRRSDGFGYHLSWETARIQAFRLSSLTGKTWELIPDPALKRLVQFTAHGHRSLASLEIRRKGGEANVYVSFLPTVVEPGSDCAIFERVLYFRYTLFKAE